MADAWTILCGSSIVTLRRDLRIGGGSLSDVDLFELFRGPIQRPMLVEICQALGFSNDRAPTDELVSRVAAAIARGDLSIERTRLNWGSSSPSTPKLVEAARSAEAPKEEKTWVGIRLIDDADPPQPVPFQRYRVELPDGSTREGMLDANGAARLSDIDPGQCNVTFPNFDEKLWARA